MKKADMAPLNDKRKERKQREDSIDRKYWDIPNKKHKGRRKAPDHHILKQAFTVLNQSNLKEWKKEFGMSSREYSEFRDLYLTSVYRTQIGISEDAVIIPQSYPPEAVHKMAGELGALIETVALFNDEVEKAKRDGNVTFLNLVKRIFGNDAKNVFDIKKNEDGNVGKNTLSEAYKNFSQWLQGQKTSELPGTFYDRDKPKGLCLLAYGAFHFLSDVNRRTTERYRVLLKMRLLAERYYIRPDEVFHLTESGGSAIGVDRATHWKLLGIKDSISIVGDDPIKILSQRFRDLQEMLKALKDI